MIRSRWYVLAIAGVVLAAAVVTALASRRNSLTWDEPVMVASGVRGVATGDFTMTWDQPPGMPYAFGVAERIYDLASKASGGLGVRRPAENGTIILPPDLAAQLPPSAHANGPVPRWGLYNRYDYARELFFKSGNDPEALAFTARLATTALAALLGIAVAVFGWRAAGPLAALLATSLFVFLPDELAQGGIAYNDVGLALTFFLGVWAVDALSRRPAMRTASVAGVALGLALAVKFSALTLGPIALVILACEWVARGRDEKWLQRVASYGVGAIVVAFVTVAILYRGDFALSQFREGVQEQLRHSSSGHGVPAYLFGTTSDTGFWYFFPVALILKTPIAFHLLALLAIIGVAGRQRWSRAMLAGPLRAAPIAIVVYLAVLMQSKLDIGVRYALAIMPFAALLVGVGLARVWARSNRELRALIAVLVVASAGSAVARYPWFLSYVTEWVPADNARTAMVDSNLDWGQGLLALRDFMRDEHADGVYLAYFGSALPEGYGIKYSPLPSWSPLPPQPRPAAPYDWIVVSSTLLEGLYETGDPFRPLRERQPDRVLGGSLFAYRRP